jgi:cell division septation protein DedD
MTSAPATGNFVVQLTSQKSENDAQASFRALQAKYPSVLAGRQPVIRRADLGDRGTYYRAQVGPFQTAEQANDLCGNLKAAGGQCIVQRN